MTHSVTFVEALPEPYRRPSGADYRHSETATLLRANPGQWAQIQQRTKRSDAATAAYQVRNGILAAFRPAGAYEAKSLTNDGKFLVFARYVGMASMPESGTTRGPQ
ncbi:hypothetical protein [Streptomyces sp. x-80]|uniref:hypothetical protein n=1 Tax=Streptomyces sp. x-80 TaxID=2789282 RepID=UPI003981918C